MEAVEDGTLKVDDTKADAVGTQNAIETADKDKKYIGKEKNTEQSSAWCFYSDYQNLFPYDAGNAIRIIL